MHVADANHVYTTCGTDEKVKFLEKLAPQKLTAINYRSQGASKHPLALIADFAEEIKKTADGVDFVLDFVGKNYFSSNLDILRRDGVLVFLAMLSGPKLPEGTNIQQLLYKRLTLKGTTLRSRSVEYQEDLLQRFKQHALPLICDGQVKVEVHEVFPWEKVVEAHKEMEANKNSGKVSP